MARGRNRLAPTPGQLLELVRWIPHHRRLPVDEALLDRLPRGRANLLQARIERFPGRSLQLRVTEQKTGRVVQGAQAEFARTWAARVPEAGDYRVDVVRRAAYCDPSVTYLLTLGLRR